MLTERQEKIIKAIIESYQKDAQPVSSNFLVAKIGGNFSSATLRNEMAQLTKLGFIDQPHTSAGRIPTVKAYQYYIEKFLNKDNEIELKDRQIRVFDKVLHEEDEDRVKLKKLARVLAQVSGQAVVMRFGEDSYSVGLTNLLRQPEFDDHELLLDVSQMLDEMSEAFNFELEEASGEPEILIGEENPFGQECTLIAGQYGLGADRGYIGVLGPRRMDYKTNYALIKKIMEMIG